MKRIMPFFLGILLGIAGCTAAQDASLDEDANLVHLRGFITEDGDVYQITALPPTSDVSSYPLVTVPRGTVVAMQRDAADYAVLTLPEGATIEVTDSLGTVPRTAGDLTLRIDTVALPGLSAEARSILDAVDGEISLLGPRPDHPLMICVSGCEAACTIPCGNARKGNAKADGACKNSRSPGACGAVLQEVGSPNGLAFQCMSECFEQCPPGDGFLGQPRSEILTAAMRRCLYVPKGDED